MTVAWELGSNTMKTSVHGWEKDPLFRVIAFLDNTGVQLFNLADEVDLHGNFVHLEKIFALGTPIHTILVAGLAALRENIRTLFADLGEQESLLQVIGSGDIELALNNTSVDEASAKAEEGFGCSHMSHVVATSEAFSHLPPQTEWSAKLLQPKSFRDFNDTFENGFPLPLLFRLKEAFGLLHRSDFVSATPYPLVEQFLIDAMDRWIPQRSIEENEAMILACGVEPSIVADIRAKGDHTPVKFVDFVVDVVFPVPPTDADTDGIPLDWLIISYVKNHEAVDVDIEKISSWDEKGEVNHTEGGPLKNVRDESISQSETSGLCGWNPDDGEVYLSESNLEQFMRDKPSLVPREILVKIRKPWQDPTITTFELENHYTVAELRAIVKKLAGLSRGPPSELSALESDLEHPIHPSLLRQAAAANNRASYVRILMALHSSSHTEEKCLGENASDALDVSFQGHEKGEDPGREIVLSTDLKYTQEAEFNISDPSLSSTQLVRHFKLQELKDYIVNVLLEPNVARTKKQCANLIVKKRRRSE
ncbi:unnamed protein product [Phytomonas sp. EM1]|nr:unnamed protein product [Phytomonas sp. EM1]|eukprot:CCW59694.1 unnamed protein product [Phytomonas sp. isolate EM1]